MKVAIIGGGIAGLTAAWLLDEDCEVTLFEQQARLGGHADTVIVSTDNSEVPIDAGFEFFSDTMFPHFNRLLNILNIPVYAYPLTCAFYNDHHTPLLLPPFGAAARSWEELFSSHLFDMLDFRYLVEEGNRIVESRNTALTIEQFIESLSLARSSKDDFLYPFLAAGWGAPLPEFKQFAAYDIMTWCVKNKPGGIMPKKWNEVVGGTAHYIQALAAQLTHAKIKLSSAIVSIAYADNIYTLIDSNGTLLAVDHVIIATNAHQAKDLLKGIPHALDRSSILDNVRYFKTAIAVHGDKRLMPHHKEDWAVVNIRYNGTDSALNIYKPWLSNGHSIFKSWVTYEACLPEPLYALRTYWHPMVDVPYFQAQTALGFVQGNYNLWLAGIYTSGVDSHDSAIGSAIAIAQQLAPRSKRLQLMLTFT